MQSSINKKERELENITRLPVPDVSGADVAFGCIDHLPRKEDIPEAFWKDSHPAARACQMIFFKGGKFSDYGFKPREGVSAGKATAAIGAALASFDPKHEHKIAGCAFLLDQWFTQEGQGLDGSAA